MDIGCIALMDGLEHNYKIRVLNLSSNSLRVCSARRIAEVLVT